MRTGKKAKDFTNWINIENGVSNKDDSAKPRIK